jgi:hypothetical protein
MTFRSYLIVYAQIDEYSMASKEIAEGSKRLSINSTSSHQQHPIERFYENRMLVMRVCEEHMHLIQRHKSCINEFADSKAWVLLFEMFMYQRQLFAEMKAPRYDARTGNMMP